MDSKQDNFDLCKDEKSMFYDNATGIIGIAIAVGGIVGLASWLGSSSKEKGPEEKMMKAPGKDGYSPRNAFKNNPKDYFKDLDVMEVPVKKIRHYSSQHQILLVGEGDFSFSLSLASAFGSATNITATSLDSEDELCKKFMDAMDNVSKLKRFGCDVQHEVDVHTMSFDNSLSLRRYDRIIFNFPHAGSRFFGREFSSYAIESHRVLVQGFLENAKEMLKENGEIHITHKTTYPFSDWKIKKLAKAEGLKLVKETKFELSHYPGYTNKRGSGGRRSDDYFPVGECSTLMFIKSHLV